LVNNQVHQHQYTDTRHFIQQVILQDPTIHNALNTKWAAIQYSYPQVRFEDFQSWREKVLGVWVKEKRKVIKRRLEQKRRVIRPSETSPESTQVPITSTPQDIKPGNLGVQPKQIQCPLNPIFNQMTVLPLPPFPSNPSTSTPVQESPAHGSPLLHDHPYSNIIRDSPTTSPIPTLSSTRRPSTTIPSKRSSDIVEDGELYRIGELMRGGVISPKRHKILCEAVADEQNIFPGNLLPLTNIEHPPSELGSPMRRRMKALVINETPPHSPTDTLGYGGTLNKLRFVSNSSPLLCSSSSSSIRSSNQKTSGEEYMEDIISSQENEVDDEFSSMGGR
jgi:hypothetical protein